MSKPKFEFFEKVKIIATDPKKQEIAGRIGAILGKSENEAGQWSYAVHIYGDDISWHLNEDELETTGEFDVEETFYDGTTIRVSVDQQGRGTIVND